MIHTDDVTTDETCVFWQEAVLSNLEGDTPTPHLPRPSPL